MGISIPANIDLKSGDAEAKLNNFKSSAEKSREAVQKIGIASGIAFAGLSAAIGLSIRSFAKFQNEMLGVKTLLDKSSFSAVSLNKGFEQMTKDALKLAATAPVAIDELTGALFDTVSAGVDASEAVIVLGESSKLAAAGLTDVKTATDGMTSALNSYGLGADQAESVAAKFFTAQKFGKCFAKGTEILLHDGHNKKVEDIVVGDKLMGDDNTPRDVLALGRGKEQMYKIKMRDNSSYTVNESHILSLKRVEHVKDGKRVAEKITNISVKEYLEKSTHWKARNLGYKKGIELENKPVHIDPYLLAVWLGGGFTVAPRICTMENEVISYLDAKCKEEDWNFHEYGINRTKTNVYSLTKDRKCRGKGSFTEQLHKYGLLGNKHIPIDYMINSKKVRLELLAGLIDTNGYKNNTSPTNVHRVNSYQFSNINKQIIDSVVWISRSCGLYAKTTEKIVKGKVYYTIHISGELDQIPCLVERRKCKKEKNAKRDVTCQSFKIEKLEVDDYYGFEIDGNSLFLLNNFNVTHNTTIEKLSSSFGLAGSSAAAYGVKLNELLAAVSALTIGGVTTQNAFIGIKALLKNISKPTKEAAQEAKKLGINFSFTAIKTKGLTKFMNELKDANGFTEESITKLFRSVEAQKAAFGLTGSSAEKYAETLAALNDEVGTLATFNRAAEEQLGSLSNRMKVLGNVAQVLSVNFGGEFAPAVSKAVLALTKLGNFLGDNETIIRYGAAIAAVGVAVTGLVVATAGLAVALPAIAGVLGIGVSMGGAASVAAGITATGAALGFFAGEAKEAAAQQRVFSSGTQGLIQKRAFLLDQIKEEIRIGKIFSQEAGGINSQSKIKIGLLEEEAAAIEKVIQAELRKVEAQEMVGPLRDPRKLPGGEIDNLFEVRLDDQRNAAELALAIRAEEIAAKEALDLETETRRREALAESTAFDSEIRKIEAELASTRLKKNNDNDIKRIKSFNKRKKLEATKHNIERMKDEGKVGDAIEKAEIDRMKREQLAKKQNFEMNTKWANASVQLAQTTAGFIALAQGSQSKAAFILSKAAAIASATISTLVAANVALAQTGNPVYSSFIMGVGAANVALIAATSMQGFAKGGMIQGGTAGRDSVPIMGQKNEFIAPVKTADEVINATADKRNLENENSFANQEQELNVTIGFTEDAFEIIENKIVERRALGISNL